ncbi:MAG: biotin transporter BioY [Clostridiaceae bacterium]|nr:biotin transporter BioY [Clostridiaceae bacterium]
MENAKNITNLKRLTINALMLAVLIVCSQITIPMPIGVPFTLQTLAIAILAYLLSLKDSLLVIGTYLIGGFLGLPIFSNFSGGPAKLVAPSAGYLFGFIPMIIFLYWSKKNLNKNKILSVVFAIAGLLSCHLIGVIWLGRVANLGFFEAAMVSSVPFLLKDIISVFLGAMLARQLAKKI